MSKIKRIHLVYSAGKRISTPDVIGRELKKSLENQYKVQIYNNNEFRIIQPGDADVLLGHWHPNPFTVFRMSAQKKGWKRIIALAPFCPDQTGWHNAFGNKIIEKCDRYLAITGNAWIKRLEESPFQHWKPKIVHLDLAVDRRDFPFLKKHFNKVKKRRFLYIGNTNWCKNISFLEKLAKELPEIDFAWMGGNQTLKNIKGLGIFDFSKKESRNLIQEYDFLIHVGIADANPTTILEAMAWGLIPVCSVQSGYEQFCGIRNIPIDNICGAVETINKLQLVPEEQLNKWQQENLDCLDKHFNWDRFCSQVLNEIESKFCPDLAEITTNDRLYLHTAELESPNYWGRPINLYRFIKANLKYALKN